MNHKLILALAAGLLAGLSCIARSEANQTAQGNSNLHAADVPKTVTDLPDGPWPQLTGPYGNYHTPPLGKPLITDPKDIRVVWKSEVDDLGVGKWGYSKDVPGMGSVFGRAGGIASPIVGQVPGVGLTIFQVYYKNSGTKKIEGNFGKGRMPDEQKTYEADDCLVAIDAATGKTRWRVANDRSGFNILSGKRAGWGVSAVYHAGKVFHLGTAFRLWAYDATSGKEVWHTDINPAYNFYQKQRQKDLATDPLNYNVPYGALLVSLVQAEDVIIAPLHNPTGHYGALGLIGFDAATGKELWRITKTVCGHCSTPAIYRKDGREYLLCQSSPVGGGKPAMSLIDPKNGKILWEIETGPSYENLAPVGDWVVNHAPVADLQAAKKTGTVYGGYHLSPEKCELAWKMPDDPKYYTTHPLPTNWAKVTKPEQHVLNASKEVNFLCEWGMDCGPMRKIYHRNGKVYIHPRLIARNPEIQRIWVIDEKTGELLQDIHPGELKEDEWHNEVMPLPIDDQVFFTRDAAHGLMGLWILGLTKDNRLEVTCEGSRWMPQVPMASGYERPFEWGYHNGRILTRGYDGRLHCWDLTRPEEKK